MCYISYTKQGFKFSENRITHVSKLGKAALARFVEIKIPGPSPGQNSCIDDVIELEEILRSLERVLKIALSDLFGTKIVQFQTDDPVLGQDLADVLGIKRMERTGERMESQRDFFSGLDVALCKDDDDAELIVEHVRRVRRARVVEEVGAGAFNQRRASIHGA